MNALEWRAGPTCFSPDDLKETYAGKGFAMPLSDAWPKGMPAMPGGDSQRIDPTLPTIVIGGAGLLGTRMVETLLRNPDRGKVIVASRNPFALLPALSAIYGMDKAIAMRRDPRLVLVEADLSYPTFVEVVAEAAGEPTPHSHRGRPSKLIPRIGAVYNLAAAVEAFAPRERLSRINDMGTMGAMALVLAQRPDAPPPRLVHASTLSVFASADGGDETLEDWLPADPRISIRGGYAQTKALAEGHVAHHLSFGASAAAVRLGLLVPDALQPIDGRSFLAAFVQSVAALGAVPDVAEESFVDMTPMDQAAEAMVAIGDSGMDGVLHYACRRTLSLTETVRIIARHAPLEIIPSKAWLERVQNLPSIPGAILESAFDKSGFLRRRCMNRPSLNADLFQSTGRIWKWNRALQAGAPEPRSAQETFAGIVERILEEKSS